MSRQNDDGRAPKTAAEEVLVEIEDQETRVTEPEGSRDDRRRNQADATTPNQEAQESVADKD